MTDWHPGTDELVALALTEAPPSDQERILTHLTTCSACRDAYAELSDGVQQALAATPSVAPPAGFSGRVLDAIAAESAPAVRPPQRSRLLLVAAAVVVGLLAGVGGTLAATTWLNRPPAASSSAPIATRLVTAAGDDVGSVGIAMLAGRSYLTLNVTAGRPGVRYDCILVGRDGGRTDGGSWVLTDEYGTGTASGSWLVPLSGEAPASVELIGPAGTVWSRAVF